MNNSFDFTFFVPTPDTTANCALSRWNDSLSNLSDFIKYYMTSQQSLSFGFSRNLNVKEMLNLNKERIKTEDDKFTYVLDYNKYGNLNANICGFSVPLIDFYNPFLLKRNFDDQHFYRDTALNNYVVHVFNKNSDNSVSERKSATLSALNKFIIDLNNSEITSDNQIARIFRKNNNGTNVSRQQAVSEIQNAISAIQTLTATSPLNVVFAFSDKNNINIEDIQQYDFKIAYPLTNINENNSDTSFYKDSLYCGCVSNKNSVNDDIENFYLNIEDEYKQEFQDKYLTPNGIEFIYLKDIICSFFGLANSQSFIHSHLLVFFKFSLEEYPSIIPFLSHDGTNVPLSKQHINISYRIELAKDNEFCWNSQKECPRSFYYDENDNIVYNDMSLESNINGMDGRDYTIWSSPVQKTSNGFVFECCMPLAFYNEDTDSYSNEYYALNNHSECDIEAGQVMYRVPVVKRIRQNIEEAVVNTQLAKSLTNTSPATQENYNSDNAVIIGGVTVDDFTENLYSVDSLQEIASENDYGNVKIIKTNNDVLDVMYNYSSTGELSYNGVTMPEEGRAIDMITMFDVLKKLNGNNPISDNTYFLSTDNFDYNRIVTTHSVSDPNVGDNQTILGIKTFENDIIVEKDIKHIENINQSVLLLDRDEYGRNICKLYNKTGDYNQASLTLRDRSAEFNSIQSKFGPIIQPETNKHYAYIKTDYDGNLRSASFNHSTLDSLDLYIDTSSCVLETIYNPSYTSVTSNLKSSNNVTNEEYYSSLLTSSKFNTAKTEYTQSIELKTFAKKNNASQKEASISIKSFLDKNTFSNSLSTIDLTSESINLFADTITLFSDYTTKTGVQFTRTEITSGGQTYYTTKMNFTDDCSTYYSGFESWNSLQSKVYVDNLEKEWTASDNIIYIQKGLRGVYCPHYNDGIYSVIQTNCYLKNSGVSMNEAVLYSFSNSECSICTIGSSSKVPNGHGSTHTRKYSISIQKSGNDNDIDTDSSNKFEIRGNKIDFYCSRITLQKNNDYTLKNNKLDIVPGTESGSEYVNLGTELNKFDNIYANQLNGCLPHLASSLSAPPVGTLLLLYVDIIRNETYTTTYYAGQKIRLATSSETAGDVVDGVNLVSNLNIAQMSSYSDSLNRTIDRKSVGLIPSSITVDLYNCVFSLLTHIQFYNYSNDQYKMFGFCMAVLIERL